MIRLYLIRHAKSSWKNTRLSDFDRPLNKGGKNDLPLMGNRLKRDLNIPNAIITSPANRACTTAKSIAEKLNFPVSQIIEEPQIYEASASTILNIVNQFNDQNKTYFVFGHNPGFTYLAEKLSGEYFGNIPTLGVVGIEFPFDSWQFVSAETGQCIYYNYPKKEE